MDGYDVFPEVLRKNEAVDHNKLAHATSSFDGSYQVSPNIHQYLQINVISITNSTFYQI